jgi:predicted MFS family arabinose efflux permease
MGLIAVALIPRDCGNTPVRIAPEAAAKGERHFQEVLRSPVFWAIFLGVLFTTIFTPIHGSQFGLVIKEQGFDSLGVAAAMSTYALGTLIGRIACGIALDFLPSRLVATVSMMLPAIGLGLLASPVDSLLAVSLAVFLIGVTVGAEGDLFSYLVGRYFRMEVFGAALGLCYAALYVASISGVMLLNRTLQAFGTYNPFLLITGGLVLLGAFLFLRLPKQEVVPKAEV